MKKAKPNYKNWHITSWAVEWLNFGIAVVGYIYDHPNFKDGEKVYIKLKTKRVFKYTYH